MFGNVGAAVDEDGLFADGPLLDEINFLDFDGAVAAVEGLRRIVAVDDVALAVVIEEEGGVHAADAAERDRLGPGAFWVFGGNVEIADPADESADDIVGAVVIADAWSVRAVLNRAAPHAELRGSVNHISDLGPVNQIFGMPDRNAGEVIEGGVDEVIVVAHPAEGGVGIKASDDGVEVFIRPGRGGGFAAVREGSELDPGGGVRGISGDYSRGE